MRSLKTRAAIVTATVLSSTILASPAWADCLPNASGTTVTCTTADTDGFNGSAINGLTINVTSA